MSDIETVNAFLQREDLSVTEQIIKDQLLGLDQSIKLNTQEREKITSSLKEKEIEFLKLSGAFDAQLKLVVALASATQAVK